MASEIIEYPTGKTDPNPAPLNVRENINIEYVFEIPVRIIPIVHEKAPAINTFFRSILSAQYPQSKAKAALISTKKASGIAISASGILNCILIAA